MKALRLLLFSALLIPLAAASQDTEPGNNTCEPLFPVDIITLDVPNNAAMDNNNDVDVFRVQVPDGGLLEATVTPLAGGATFRVEVLNNINNCESIASSANEASGNVTIAAAVVCPGPYNVRVRLLSGNAVPYTLIASTNNGDDWMECNNTPATATPVPVNTTFEARLYGTHTDIAAGTGFDVDGDQDWFRVDAPSCGVLNIGITNVNALQEIKIECFNSNMTPIATSPDVNGGVNASISALLQAGTSYIRISDRFGFNCGNQCIDPYDLSSDMFTVTLTFDDEDDCECNNRIEEACQVPINTTFEAKLWGLNSVISDNSILPDMDLNGDQDWYQVDASGCGVLTIGVTDVNSSQEIKIECFNSGMSLIGTSSNVFGGAATSISVLLQEGISYIRISDRFGFSCGNQCIDPYDLADDPFTVTLDFDTTDVCEYNNTFTTACEQQVGEPFQFKIFGTNSTNYYHPNDRDFFVFTPDECGTVNFGVASIPPGFTIRARLYNDTTNIDSFIGAEAVTTGPNPLSMDRPVVAGQTYYLMVRENSDGATNAQLMTGTIGLTPANIPPPTITASGPTAICPGSSVTLTSSVATGNVWSTSETTQSIVVSEAGTYSVTAYDGQGCPATSEVVVVSVLPATVADLTVGSINGGVVVFANNSSHATQYLWEFGDGSSSTEQNPTHTYTTNGEYTVTLTAIGPCGQESTTQAVIVSSVGVEEHHAARFTLRPNPTNGLVALDLATGMQGHSTTLFDATGRSVLERSIANEGATITLDLSDQETGIYFVHVMFTNGTKQVQRLVKQ